MGKKILLTGATDGLGLETAKRLAALGHTLLLHGRSASKLSAAKTAVSAAASGGGDVETFRADLSDLSAVDALADAVLEKHSSLDVLINNAGVLKLPHSANPVSAQNIDVRYAVNTLAPYRLTRRLEGALSAHGGSRVVNLSSAAQSPVNQAMMASADASAGMPAFELYAQSKLGITMWSRHLADEYAKRSGTTPSVVSVNPGSMLATKMVREGFGAQGHDISIGADILVRAAVGADFEGRSGAYFDNDARSFSRPHSDAGNPRKNAALVGAIEDILAEKLG